MWRWFFLLCLLGFNAQAYIEGGDTYTLLPKGRYYYQELAKEMYANGAYNLETIQSALNVGTNTDLAYFFHALAYDEVRDSERVATYLEKIANPTELFEKYPPAGLALCDLYLRMGKFSSIAAVLPKRILLTLEDELRARGQYYLGMSHFLQSGEMNTEFKIAKNRFEAARRLYYEKKDNNAIR